MPLLEESFSNLADKIPILQIVGFSKWKSDVFCYYVSHCAIPVVMLTALIACLTPHFKEKRCFLVNIFTTNLLNCC